MKYIVYVRPSPQLSGILHWLAPTVLLVGQSNSDQHTK